MDKHVTDIELFEFVNNLIDDQVQKKSIASHLAECKDCALKLEQEKTMAHALSSGLKVDENIDVTNKVADYFTEKPIISFVYDSNGLVYFILVLTGILMGIEMMGDYSIAEKNETISYIMLIILAVMSIFSLDFLMKYFRQKKQQVIS